MNKERVLIITDLPEIGGSSAICASLAERFNSWGAQVCVLSRYHAGYKISNGVVRLIEGMNGRVWWTNGLKGNLAPLVLLEALMAVRDYAPTRILINGAGWMFGLVKLVIPDAEFLYYYINHDTASMAFKRLRWFSLLVDRFAVITPVSAEPLRAQLLSPVPVRWLPQFTEPLISLPALLQPYFRTRPVAGFVGWFTEAKGVKFILQEWSSVDPGCDVLLFGDGPCRGEVDDAVLKTHGRIRYEGAFDPADRWVALPEFFRKIDFLVMPSLRDGEGIPTVMLEAMCLGVPVLATDKGGLACFLRADMGADFPYCIEALPLNKFMARVSDYANHAPFDPQHKHRVREYFQSKFGSKSLSAAWRSFFFSVEGGGLLMCPENQASGSHNSCPVGRSAI